MPLPNTRVIGNTWSTHHRSTAVGQLTATGRIDRPASGGAATFDESTGRTTPADPTVIYGPDPIRVQRLQQAVSDSSTTVTSREQTIRQYQVTVDIAKATTAIAVNDIVTVTACDDDPHLVGQPLRVRDIRIGSLAWQRDLLCEDIAPTTR